MRWAAVFTAFGLGLFVWSNGYAEEPDFGDTHAQAHPVVLVDGGAEIDGEIGAFGGEQAGDVDVFSLNLDPGVSYVVWTSGAGWTRVRLYDTDGTTSIKSGWDDISIDSVTGGVYYIAISADGDCGRGDYTLNVATNATDDHGNTFDSVKPADTLTDPDDIDVDHTGNTELSYDQDYVYFTGNDDTLYHLTVDGGGHVSVYDQNRNHVTGGNDEWFTYQATRGEYIFKFYKNGDNAGPYTYRIETGNTQDLPDASISSIVVDTIDPGRGRNDITVFPGELVEFTIQATQASANPWPTENYLYFQLYLSPVGARRGGDIYLGSFSQRMNYSPYISMYYDYWRLNNYSTNIPAGYYRLSFTHRHTNNPQRDGSRLWIDDIALTDGTGETVLWSEDFEHGGAWTGGGNVWYVTPGETGADKAAVIIDDDLHEQGGSYAAASAADLAPGESCTFYTFVTVPQDDSRLRFWNKVNGDYNLDDFDVNLDRVFDADHPMTVTRTLDIPHETPATSEPDVVHNVRATIDPWGYVAESDEVNNTAVTGPGNQVTVRNMDYPDLVVSSVSAQLPTGPRTLDVVEEGMVEVTWTVTNQGQAVALAGPDGMGWDDEIKLFEDPTYFCDEWDLGTLMYDGEDLDPTGRGTSYTRTMTVQLPTGLVGTYYIGVRTDADGQYRVIEGEGEGEENNSTAATLALNIIPKPRPNLVVTDFQLAQESYGLGESATVTYTVTNDGDAPCAPYFNDRIYLSTDDVQDGNYDRTFGDLDGRALFEEGGSSSWAQETFGPFEPGTYTFEWIYQKSGSSTYYDDTVWIDNVEFATARTVENFTLTDLPPDWETDAVNGWLVDQNEDADYDTSTSFALRSGAVGTDGASTVWITREFTEATFVRFHRRLSCSYSHDLLFRIRSTLNPGESIQRTVTAQMPSSMDYLGEAWLVLEIDRNDHIYEGVTGGEDDNEVLGTGQTDAFGDSFTLEEPDHADLTVSNLQVEGADGSTVYWGDQLTLRWDVTNNGTVPAVPEHSGYYFDSMYDRAYWVPPGSDASALTSGNEIAYQYSNYNNYHSGEYDWAENRYSNTYLQAGTYTFAWIYAKGSTTSSGLDTVWIDQLTYVNPDGEEVVLDFSAGIPDGWLTFGDADWQADATTGHTDSASLSSGDIADGQTSGLAASLDIGEGYVKYYYRTSTQSYDRLFFFIDTIVLPGQTVTREADFIVPMLEEADLNKWFGVWTDQNDDVLEYSDEDNNTLIVDAPFTVAEPDHPDLLVRDVSLALSARSLATTFWGQELEVTYTVENQGTAVPSEGRNGTGSLGRTWS
ncbi:MAG: hypothetical protein HN406_35645, partial [Lentisphaerae bacterium]|nr:hypothetical protein [Lentisphaerota bacterium]